LKSFRNTCFVLLAAYSLQLVAVSCTTADLYEKTASIPGHSWKSSFRPSFTFTIKDTASTYQLFLVLRHTDKYNFNNIWLNLTVKGPGKDSITIRIDKALANDEKGWLATGMDDIYEHRIELNNELADNNISFRKPGDYTFTLEQIMRQNPLNHVLNAGLRIEKKK
jgi:gliding motility-associated lipoprotein GldH